MRVHIARCGRLARALAAGVIAAGVGGCARAPAIDAAPVPAGLAAPADQYRILSARGTGEQIYECRAAADDAQRFGWELRAPAARLSSPTGRSLGHHYAGPTWEAADGSKVVGEVVARDGAGNPHAIPWLLLRAKSTTGNGVFSRVQSIQRLHTVGGMPPATGCDSTRIGAEARVAYSADYVFYGRSR